MTLAWISVAALGVVVAVSCTTRLNPGILAIVFAGAIGAFAPTLTIKAAIAGFPADLFVTLAGVMLLFAQAQVNGTLDQVARLAVHLCRGRVVWIAPAFFLLSAFLSAIGAGTIAAVALLAPTAMAVAARTGIPSFLMSVMVGHGAVGGGMSPFAPTGVIANGIMARNGLPGHEAATFLHVLAASSFVAFAAYFAFGGRRLWGQGSATIKETVLPPAPFSWRHGATLAVIAGFIATVLAFNKAHVGLTAFAAAAVLGLLRLADEKETFRAMPWNVILMVCGMTMLTAILEKTGGIDQIKALIARVSTPGTIPGVAAFMAGAISVYSSTSGVVLPLFLPIAPGLVEKLGGGDPVAVASSMNIGANLVDVSPLSTVGALCLAAVLTQEDRRVLFNKLLAWGLSMSVVAALLCLLFFSVLW